MKSVRLAEIVEYVRGITFRPEDKVDPGTPGSVICFTTRNIQQDLDDSSVIAVPEELVRRPEQRVRSGDILVSAANSWELVGKCCYVGGLTYAAAVGGFIATVRPTSTKVLNSRYLYWWMSNAKVQHKIRHLARQTTNIANLPVEAFLGLSIPLPAVDVQVRIAATLDKADEIRRKREQSVKLAGEFVRSVFIDHFGDPNVNDRRWPTRSFDQALRDETSRSPAVKQSAFGASGRYPIVDQGQRVPAGYTDDPAQLCVSELPVIVFGDHTRIVKLVADPFAVGAEGVKVLVPQPGIEPTYLFWLIRLLHIPSLGYSRHMKVLREKRFPVPPLELQGRFARLVDGVGQYHERLLASLDAAKRLGGSLAASAFGGVAA